MQKLSVILMAISLVSCQYSAEEAQKVVDKAIEAQMKDKVTTFIEVILNQELGEPFRRDAMKKPVSVAGIDPSDFRPQQPVS